MAWAPTYATTPELAAYMRIPDNVDDTELGLAAEAASRAIDHATNRQFGLVDTVEARTYYVRWSRRRGLYVADIEDLMTPTGLVVTVSASEVASSDYELTPLNASADNRPWKRIGLRSATPSTLGTGRPTVTIEARWGWTSFPDTIKNACLRQAMRLVKGRDAPFGVAGSPDLGSEIRLLAKLDPLVEDMIRPYRRDHPMLVAG